MQPLDLVMESAPTMPDDGGKRDGGETSLLRVPQLSQRWALGGLVKRTRTAFRERREAEKLFGDGLAMTRSGERSNWQLATGRDWAVGNWQEKRSE